MNLAQLFHYFEIAGSI